MAGADHGQVPLLRRPRATRGVLGGAVPHAPKEVVIEKQDHPTQAVVFSRSSPDPQATSLLSCCSVRRPSHGGIVCEVKSGGCDALDLFRDEVLRYAIGRLGFVSPGRYEVHLFDPEGRPFGLVVRADPSFQVLPQVQLLPRPAPKDYVSTIHALPDGGYLFVCHQIPADRTGQLPIQALNGGPRRLAFRRAPVLAAPRSARTAFATRQGDGLSL